MGLLSRKARGAGQPQKVEKELTVINPSGLHMRPAAIFVRIASRYRCEVWVAKEGEEINGKSIMGLMMLRAGQGSKLKIRCEGPDAARAVEEVIASVVEAETGERVFSD
ncbi:MAG TPA: HPr family phosphocarrier protein [Chthoniobacterales bacterium]|jgi:phosphocarrier protein|nr:HPr family phosphocarrier protein [Chthoniobacterales bacterium]